MATAMSTPGGPDRHRPPPPRPKLPPTTSAEVQQQREIFSSLNVPPGSRRASIVDNAQPSMRALQLLKESRPPPPRRQSVTVPLPPRGLNPLQPLGTNSGPPRASRPPTPNATRRPPFTDKPPPPSTQPPMAAIEAARRHSTGNMRGTHPMKVLAGGISTRPPPPRGPPPSSRLSPAAAKGDAPVGAGSHTTRESLRRRSSLLRGPPPGPPPPGRRPSAAPPGPAQGVPDAKKQSDARASIQRKGQQQQQRAKEDGYAHARDYQQIEQRHQQSPEHRGPGATPTAGINIRRESNDAATFQQADMDCARRVSFSAYRGPSGTQNSTPSNDHTRSTAAAGYAIEKQTNNENDAGTVASAPHSGARPLPQAGGKRGSQSGSAADREGRSQPLRPPGYPPGEIRRYSITNELSNGTGNFSRRMSKTPLPSDEQNNTISTALPQKRSSVESNHPTIGVGTGQGTGQSATGPPTDVNGLPSQQRTAPAGDRAAVLWYNMGVTRQKERDARGAVECYSRAVAEGHAKARHNLAAIFEKGAPGVPKDEGEAVRLFRLAAEQGLAESCYSLAMHLKFGLGIEQDDAQCVYYLEKASEYGLAKAIFNLGLMYEKQRGVSPDAPEADLLEATRECYQAAAEAGVTKAAVNVGVLYLTGRIPGREPGEALEWFKKAADEGDLSGLWNLSLCYERGVGVAKDPIVARALQDQCKEREKQQQQQQQHSLSGLPAGPAVAVALSRRRSSYPSVSQPCAKPMHPPNVVDDDSNRLNRKRSSSVPNVTSPPPEGSPPHSPLNHAATGSGNPHGTTSRQFETGERKSNGYNYVPESKGDIATKTSEDCSRGGEVSSMRGLGGMEGKGGVDRVVVLPPPNQRRDSLILKPTPQAIARVKAAVERRRAMEAAARQLRA